MKKMAHEHEKEWIGNKNQNKNLEEYKENKDLKSQLSKSSLEIEKLKYQIQILESKYNDMRDFYSKQSK